MATSIRCFSQISSRTLSNIRCFNRLNFFEVSASAGLCARLQTPAHRSSRWHQLQPAPCLASVRGLHSKTTHQPHTKDITGSSHQSFSTSPAVQYEEDEHSDSLEVVEAVNSQLTQLNHGRLFAVIHIDRHQRKVTTDDLICIDYHVEADIGERITLNKVLLLGGKDFTLVGRPVLSSKLVRVEAVVVEKTLSHDKIHFLYRKRKRSRTFKVDKTMQTILRISSIQVTSLSGQQSVQ